MNICKYEDRIQSAYLHMFICISVCPCFGLEEVTWWVSRLNATKPLQINQPFITVAT